MKLRRACILYHADTRIHELSSIIGQKAIFITYLIVVELSPLSVVAVDPSLNLDLHIEKTTICFARFSIIGLCTYSGFMCSRYIEVSMHYI